MASSIEEFASRFPSQSSLQASKSYSDSVDSNWAANTIAKPTCIFRPSSAQELAEAVLFINEHKILFQVRGLGNNANRQWSHLEGDGVLIDTSSFKYIQLKKEAAGTVISAGCGVGFPEIYEVLKDTDLTIAGANIPIPGIAGFYSGGGFSPYWNRYGYSSNSIAEFEVVTTNGKVLNVTKDNHSDLFWALKYGNTNFGIITRFSIKCFPSQNIWSGSYIIPGPGIEAAHKAAEAFWTKHGNSETSSVSFISPNNSSLVMNLFYAGPEEKPSDFELLASVPKVKDTTQKTDWLGITQDSKGFMPKGLRRYWSCFSVKKDTEIVFDLVQQIHTRAAADLVGVEKMTEQVVVLMQTKESQELNADHPCKSTNAVDIFQVLVLATWKHAVDDERVRHWMETTTANLREQAKERGVFNEFIYINDADEKQNVYNTLEPGCLQRLRTIAETYDSTGVFQKLRVGGPKLWT